MRTRVKAALPTPAMDPDIPLHGIHDRLTDLEKRMGELEEGVDEDEGVMGEHGGRLDLLLQCYNVLEARTDFLLTLCEAMARQMTPEQMAEPDVSTLLNNANRRHGF